MERQAHAQIRDVPLDVVIPANEPERLAAVSRYDIPATSRERAFDRVAALAARTLDMPIATVTIVDKEHIWFKATVGPRTGIIRTKRAPGLCASAILQAETLVVRDTLTDLRTAGNPLVRGEPGVRFYAAAPITTPDGFRLGTVNVMDTRPREVSREDLDTLRDLAAVVMDELELLRLTAMTTCGPERVRPGQLHLQRINQVLQQALLPARLPLPRGYETAAYYHVASADQVGGDFYDMFELNDGRWAFFLGDVCGKGAEAAALTSLTRYSLRASATYGADPVAVLDNLTRVLLQEYQFGDPLYCTVLFGVASPGPDGVEITLAGGGHPPALIIRGNGEVAWLHPVDGMLVGLLPDPCFAVARAHLAPGDALLLYTDGLTEARTIGGALYGEDRLADFAVTLAGRPAGEIVAELEKVLTGFGPGLSDDTAVLAISVPPSER
ncbi:MAG: SpoIIE family protein phosphatase [Nonomuraea sp.]|nr:SpoIIE family protein phosphatase [Nonomuraea sp.]